MSEREQIKCEAMSNYAGNSQGQLVRLGQAIYTVSVAPDGSLSGRNEVTNRATRTSLGVVDSAWHRLTVHADQIIVRLA